MKSGPVSGKHAEENNFGSHQVGARRFNETKQARRSRSFKSQSGKVSEVPDASLACHWRERKEKHADATWDDYFSAATGEEEEARCENIHMLAGIRQAVKRDATPRSETDAVTGNAHEECHSYVTARCFHLRATSAASSSRRFNINVAQSESFKSSSNQSGLKCFVAWGTWPEKLDLNPFWFSVNW